ncbi:MAG TPA: hypothetical protein VKR06_14450 [Ktedonosporobacter sp.]|nr:hypothetical protein [Ktedonosporobacter sp.]
MEIHNYWDRLIKKLIRLYPQTFVSLFLPGAIFLSFLPVGLNEAAGDELEMDILMMVRYQGKKGLLQIEAQTRNDLRMDRRLLRYTIETEELQKQVPRCGVLYLTSKGDVPASPLQWHAGGKLCVFFDFESVELRKLSRNDLLNRNEIGLWPLLSLAKDGTTRALVEDTCGQLRAMNELETEFLTVCLAELAFRTYNSSEDYEWLIRRKQSMFETLPESTFMRELVEKGRAEERAKADAKAHARELEQLRQARKTLMALIEGRFPLLVPLAKEQVRQIKHLTTLQEQMLKIGMAANQEEAERALLNWQKPTRKRKSA